MISALSKSLGLHRLLLAAWAWLLLLVPIMTHAQCPARSLDPDAPPPPVNTRPVGEEVLPENGHLSNTTYTSDFFGFSIDLPLSAQGHKITLPLMPPRQHALLALAYEEGSHHGTLTIAAIDPHAGFVSPSTEAQKQKLRDWGNYGNNQTGGFVHPDIPDYMLNSGHFNYSLHHKRDNYIAVFSTRVRNYNLKVLVTSNDKSFIDKTRQALNGVRFYCTEGDGVLSTADGQTVKPDGEPYEGPTVPTLRVEAALQEQPGIQGIAPGSVSGGVYRNPALGLQYDLPKGWQILSPEAASDPPRNANAAREQQFLHACSKTLLRIASAADAQQAQAGAQRFIILRALDPTCLDMRTPASLTDKRTAAEVGSSLEVLSEFGEVSSYEMVSLSDHLFVILHGSIASHSANDELASRMSQSIYLTRYNKMLFVWSLIAPTSSDLNTIPSTRIAFEDTAPLELHPTVTAQKQ